MRIGSLFSGIGGLELGLERAGLGDTSWQCESDSQCLRVLNKWWPNIPRFRDVETLYHPPGVDLLCGGFPCQDLSDASRGRGGGVNGARSGLWKHLVRVAQELSPRWVVVENVAGAAGKSWVPVLRRALWDAGYSSVPVRMRASQVGAPHKGTRIFLVAQAYGQGKPDGQVDAQMAQLPHSSGPVWQNWGKPPPAALGVADGVPKRLHRLRMTGNSVVPAMAQAVGSMIMNIQQGGGDGR